MEEYVSKIEQLVLKIGGQKQAESGAAHTNKPGSDLDVEVVDMKVEKLRMTVMVETE